MKKDRAILSERGNAASPRRLSLVRRLGLCALVAGPVLLVHHRSVLGQFEALLYDARGRAFGPGPLTGSLAILITDAGTFGKLFSEALELRPKERAHYLETACAGDDALPTDR